MTDTNIDKLIDKLYSDFQDKIDRGSISDFAEALAHQVMLAEREACAKVAKNYASRFQYGEKKSAALDIASDIRARSEI